MAKGKLNIRASLAAVGIGFWLTMAGGVSAGPSGSERIVGGSVADPSDWRFIAAIATPRGEQFCGGSVVDSDSVVTAAHCVEGLSGRSLRVITGRPDLEEENAGQELKVSEVKVHRQYIRKGHRDVAVLTLRSPTKAPPVLLPTVEEGREEAEAETELRVAGWGATKGIGGRESSVLLDVAVTAISDEDCAPYFTFFRPSEEVCAFGDVRPNGKYRDSCYGDSGGPLIADASRGPLLIGLVSYGGTQCGVEKPGVYAQVADNLRFIERHADLP